MNKQFGLLLILAVLAVGASAWLSYDAKPKIQQAGYLLEEGLQQAAQVSAIQLQNSQGMLLNAELQENGWVATLNEFSPKYPLSKNKLSTFLSDVARAKLVEEKTAKAENYHHLGVDTIEDIDSLATLVTLRFNNQSKPWQLLVGNKVAAGEGTYVRFPESKQSWKIDTSIDLPENKSAWLSRPIISLDKNDIDSVSRIDSNTWTMSKVPEQQTFKLKLQPKDKELRYPGVLDSLVSSIVELDFEDVFSADDQRWNNAELVTKLRVVTQSKQSLELHLSKIEETYLLQIRSEKIDGVWLNWTYELSAFIAQQLIKTRDDFLAEVSPKQKPSQSTSQAEVEEGDSPQ